MKTAPHSVTQPKKNKIKRDSVIKQVANGRGQQSGAVGRPQVYMYKRRLTPANKTLKCVVPCLFDNEFFFSLNSKLENKQGKSSGTSPNIYQRATRCGGRVCIAHRIYLRCCCFFPLSCAGQLLSISELRTGVKLLTEPLFFSQAKQNKTRENSKLNKYQERENKESYIM